MSDAAPASTEPHKIADQTEGAQSKSEQEQNQAATEISQESAPNGEFTMHVKVHSPFKVYYEDSAFSVSAENITGPFDILPKHHRFITLLTQCEMILRSAKGEQKIQISGGIMHVKADNVVVFLDV